MKLVHEHLQEKFTESGDSIKDMDIGIYTKFKKWLDEYKDHRLSPYTSKYEDSPSTYLVWCVEDNKIELIDYLINVLDADPNMFNVNSLRVAAWKKYYNIAIKLIKAGASMRTAKRYCENNLHGATLRNIIEIEELYNKEINEKFIEDGDPIKDMGIGGIDIYKNAQQIYTPYQNGCDHHIGYKKMIKYLQEFKNKVIEGKFKVGFLEIVRNNVKFRINEAHTYRGVSKISFTDSDSPLEYFLIPGQRYFVYDEW